MLCARYVEMESDEVMRKEFSPLVTAVSSSLWACRPRRGWQAPQKPTLRLQVALGSNQADAKSERATQTFTPLSQSHSASHSFPPVICKNNKKGLNLSEQMTKS